MKSYDYIMSYRPCRGLLAILLAALGMVSCHDHTDIYDSSIRVGSILLTDNTVISPMGYDASEHQAAGVIFYVNKDTALVVGLRELGSHQFSDTLSSVSGVVNDAVSKCGTENTAAIVASGINSPAVESVLHYLSPVSGWVLPSAGELRALSANRCAVETAMRIIEGDAFSNSQYVSSSQDGSSSESEQMYYLSVSLANGFVTSTVKTSPGAVRPVMRIR